MAIETMEGLIQAFPEADRESVQKLIDAHADEKAREWKSKHDATAAEYRKTKGAVTDFERQRAAWEADLANAREAAGKVTEHEAARTAAEQALAALKVEHEAARARAAKWERERWEQHIAEVGGLDPDKPEVAHWLVDHLALKPTFDAADLPALGEAESKRLREYLDKPENRERYVRGGKRYWQEPAAPDANNPKPPAVPSTLKGLDPITNALIAQHTGMRLP